MYLITDDQLNFYSNKPVQLKRFTPIINKLMLFNTLTVEPVFKSEDSL